MSPARLWRDKFRSGYGALAEARCAARVAAYDGAGQMRSTQLSAYIANLCGVSIRGSPFL